ncbi:unnamed protein product, partial [Staurois parvus]
MATEARLEKSSSSDLELSDISVSESMFRAPLRTRATSTAKTKKVLRVLPLHHGPNNQSNIQEEVIPVVKKTRKAAASGQENEISWEVNMRTDVLLSGREKILSLLNNGSVKELKSLQKIGDKKSKLIVGWRE